jgi:hypothetical protein
MQHEIVGSMIAAGVSLIAVGASGQLRDLARPGQVAISAERLAGLFVLDGSTDINGTVQLTGPLNASGTSQTNTDTSNTTFALLGNQEAAGPAGVPRFALDVFVTPNVSVGGSIMYFTRSLDTTTEQTITLNNPVNATQRNRTETETSRGTFLVSPRAGLGAMFTGILGIWGHAGITWASQKDEEHVTTRNLDTNQITGDDTTTTKASLLSFALDAQLLIRPVEAFAVGVGPFIELPLSGSVEVESDALNGSSNADGDLSATSYGLMVGVIGWL